jgi:hypothetical protein
MVNAFRRPESIVMQAAVLTAITLLLFAAASAQAAVYKCATDQGVVYQDAACPPGKELRNLDEDPATLSVVPGTPVPAARPAPSRKPPPASQPTPKAPAARSAAHKARSGDAAERKFVHTGMSEAEVVMRIGRPDVESKGRGKSGKRWAYLPAAGDANTLTTLTIAGGAVVDVERKVAR